MVHTVNCSQLMVPQSMVHSQWYYSRWYTIDGTHSRFLYFKYTCINILANSNSSTIIVHDQINMETEQSLLLLMFKYI